LGGFGLLDIGAFSVVENSATSRNPLVGVHSVDQGRPDRRTRTRRGARVRELGGWLDFGGSAQDAGTNSSRGRSQFATIFANIQQALTGLVINFVSIDAGGAVLVEQDVSIFVFKERWASRPISIAPQRIRLGSWLAWSVMGCSERNENSLINFHKFGGMQQMGVTENLSRST
jgi:hypothetical protein